MKLRSLDVGPPGNWRYRQEETGHWMTGITFGSLIKKVAQHRQNNKLPMGDVAKEIEEQICERMEAADQLANCDSGTRYASSVGWQQVEAFLKTAGAYVASGGALVSQSEAERRAAICAQCPLNVGMHGCSICRATIEVFRSSILKRSTEKDKDLRACGVCGCENKAQVHLPLATLRAGTGELDYSPNPQCWKLKGGVNESSE